MKWSKTMPGNVHWTSVIWSFGIPSQTTCKLMSWPGKTFRFALVTSAPFPHSILHGHLELLEELDDELLEELDRELLLEELLGELDELLLEELGDETLEELDDGLLLGEELPLGELEDALLAELGNALLLDKLGCELLLP